MKKRKRFEYKTQRKTKEKEVYLQYIQYEISVMQLIKLRREVQSTNYLHPGIITIIILLIIRKKESISTRT